MEGPTPVSSLLHSSTIVVAGVFLLIRINHMYNRLSRLILLVGCLTMLFRSLSAMGQSDLKKIIAYSTTSQLGFIVCSVRLGYPNLAIFHLCMHAFFKAIIFLTSGFFIHNKGVNQDLRRLGSTNFVFMVFILGSLSLGGIPFFTGYYSKDLILENMYGSVSNRFMVVILIVSSIITLGYSIRSILFLQALSSVFSKIGNFEYGGSFYFICRLLFFSLVGGFFFSFYFFNEEPYLGIFEKMLPLFFIFVSLVFIGGNFSLSFISYIYNPLYHRVGLFFFYKMIEKFFVFEFFF